MDEDFLDEDADLSTPPLFIGDEVPNFNADTTKGQIEFHEQARDRWTLLVTAPKLQHPVAVSILRSIMELKGEFKARDVQIYFLAMDTRMSVRLWLNEVEELIDKRVDLTIIIDDKAYISKALGLVRPDEKNFLRALVPSTMALVVDPNLHIQLLHTNAITQGHNFNEIIRVLDSVQLTTKHEICTPANWSSDEEVFILPHLNILQAAETFVKGFLEIRPWFRLTAIPDAEDAQE